MATLLPPSAGTPLPRPTPLMLAEAQLARQTQLLQALASEPGEGAGTRPGASPAPPSPPTAPPAADLVQLSAQARAQLAASAAPPTAAAGPATELPPALQRTLTQLVQQVLAGSGLPPATVLAAQAWTPAQAAAALREALRSGAPLVAGPAAHGVFQAPQGERGFALTLQLPAAWAQAGQASGAAAQAGAPTLALLRLPLAQAAQAPDAGVFALALQAGRARTSALLVIDVAPWGPSPPGLYGRELLLARTDPWIALAALQASGQWRDLDEAVQRRASAPLCATPGCLWAGRTPCPQPFCPALQADALQPPEPVTPRE